MILLKVIKAYLYLRQLAKCWLNVYLEWGQHMKLQIFLMGLSSGEMDSVTRDHNLDEAVSISNRSNIFGKGMHSIIRSPAVGKY